MTRTFFSRTASRLEIKTFDVVVGCDLFNSLASDPEDQPAVVNHRKNNHRRIEEATPRDVVTRFGKISLVRSRYRRGRSGKTIFPLEIALGLQRGFTPAAANTVGRQFTSTGSSQGRTIGFVKDHLGCAIGSTRLRKLGKHLAAEMEPFREQCQFEQLQQWLAEARKTNAKSIVLSVSRDAVSLGIAPFGYFEMASVATLTVLADGKRWAPFTSAEHQKRIKRHSQSNLLLCSS